ncbi:phosphatidylinositol mannoside acyltransferase [Mycobacterium kansasii]|uniref:Phosphatidylinositol mannoside acyltransferase n=1 Tax=Mycobacterium kansasii TaxID=1768 RepID=A0A1V3XRL6_MYCKA|nr:phosphatidylinositol mannoside acyltransferase [Mycobacterium kansasii]
MTTTPAGLQFRGSPRRLLTGHATDWAYAAGWRVVRAMPEFAARNVFDAGAHYAARRGGPEQLRKNLARVIGVRPADVPDSLMRASLESYARYWREAFRLPTMNHRKVARQIDNSFRGLDHLDAALAAGRGVVLALPHSGNWDMAGMWLAQTHGTFTTVAERLKPESLYRRFIEYRERLGFEVLPLSGGGKPPFEVLCERLRPPGGLPDGRARPDPQRCRGQLFRRTHPDARGPAKLAIETGAALLPAHCWFERNGWGFRVYPALDCTSGDVGAIIQALADRFAANIAEHPADWHMLQPQWLADLSDARRARLRHN